MNWVAKNRLYFYVFGGLIAVVSVVSGLALSDSSDLSEHVWFRTLLHLPWGFVLYCLFTRLLQVAEAHLSWSSAKWTSDYRYFYGICIGVVIAIAVNQEFGFPGDFRHAENWQLREQLKSFGDIAGWLFGALAAAWRDYFMADDLAEIRKSRLRRKRERRA